MRSPKLFAFAAMATVLAASTASAQAVDLVDGFGRLDLNHDGVVTRAEFIATRHTRFAALDRNGDRYLTVADIPALASFMPQAAQAREMLARFDTDQDGRVSEAEFIAGSLGVFDAADLNHDGVLTMAEARLASPLSRRR